MQMQLHVTITVLMLFLCSLGHAFASENITVQNAWLREAPSHIKVMAGYLDVTNTSDKPRTLISAKSVEFERIEFHLSQIEDGIATMQVQKNILISANTTFLFTPGSYHLMLFNNIVPMRQGKLTSITLTFADGQTHAFDILVKKYDAVNTHQHD